MACLDKRLHNLAFVLAQLLPNKTTYNFFKYNYMFHSSHRHFHTQSVAQSPHFGPNDPKHDGDAELNTLPENGLINVPGTSSESSWALLPQTTCQYQRISFIMPLIVFFKNTTSKIVTSTIVQQLNLNSILKTQLIKFAYSTIYIPKFCDTSNLSLPQFYCMLFTNLL